MHPQDGEWLAQEQVGEKGSSLLKDAKMSSFAENMQFPERKKGPETMRTNLATVLDPSRRSNDARDFETALRRKIVGQDQAIEKVAEIYQMFLAGLNAPGRPEDKY